ncbi:OPT protein, partial [Sylvietta virens]|nr:OPT protein [Sylvietta virens]
PPAGRRMCPLGWLAPPSLCLGTLWAVPAPPRRKADKPKADLTPPENLDLDNYDLTSPPYGEILDLSNYEAPPDYGDPVPKIEVGTLAPPPPDPKTLPELGETTPPTPKLLPPAPIPAPPELSAPPAPPGCQPCLCLGTSAPPDDAGLERIPALPPPTAYLYARFNRIAPPRARDFAGLEKLKPPPLSSNSIRWAEAAPPRLLPSLQELLLPPPRLTALPELPRSPPPLDARLNRIASAAPPPEAFRDLKQLQPPHLSDNQLDFIPVPPPESLCSLHLQNNPPQTMHEDTFCDSHPPGQIRRALEDIRLPPNPINLSLFPNAFPPLPRLPTGRFS